MASGINISQTLKHRSEIRLSSSFYDKAGQLLYNFDAFDRHEIQIKTQDEYGRPVSTTIGVDGSEVHRSTYLDGSLCKVSGNGALPMRYEYGVEDGLSFTKTIHLGNDGRDLHWNKSFRNGQGLPQKIQHSDGSWEFYEYDHLGRKVKFTSRT